MLGPADSLPHSLHMTNTQEAKGTLMQLKSISQHGLPRKRQAISDPEDAPIKPGSACQYRLSSEGEAQSARTNTKKQKLMKAV